MGCFSWKTQDTNRSIPAEGSSRKPFTVYMLDNRGNKWEEPCYEGYGEFAGKDFFELLAEMNGLESCRDRGIDLFYSDEPFISPNLVENKNSEWTKFPPESCEFQGYFYEDSEIDWNE